MNMSQNKPTVGWIGTVSWKVDVHQHSTARKTPMSTTEPEQTDSWSRGRSRCQELRELAGQAIFFYDRRTPLRCEEGYFGELVSRQRTQGTIFCRHDPTKPSLSRKFSKLRRPGESEHRCSCSAR
jgi:hypothetical protein